MKSLQRQIAFVEASTATKTAGDCKRALERSIDREFDRPVKYTQNAIAIRPALKSRPVARVFVKDRQADYLIYQARGGVRTPKGKALVMPVNARLNRYGNLSRNYLKNQLAKPNVFSGKVNGVAGVYQRMKSGRMKLLVAFESEARYRKRWNPDSIVRRTAQRMMPIHYRNQLSAAFRQVS
ncbi:hypothetical protein K1W69_24600 [Hoeflea sp. WL0058]|uniref:Uncharacterized protein n=1 Tax=Flavimaribacter sediminis TaxID=2865987 RepID=A0AAE2ZT74_9HYPH|nr:hypothetical protein [Flavimaribacter sediminis]MBW8640395.1 hypothetical protein [Flavimaribacter sediminis]